MDSYQRSARNPLRAFTLSREAERRADAAWLERQRAGARVIPVFGERFPVDVAHGRPVTVEIAATGADPEQLIFLGHDGEQAWFAWDAGDAGAESVTGLGGAPLWDLRRAAQAMKGAFSGLLAYSRALCHWHRQNRYCGACGSPMERADGGHVLRCSGCGQVQFPRVDPAVIVRITHGQRVLLGRQSVWPARRYSVLAGFVEAGESLEDAVRREVLEEANVALARIDYHSSQPWPFPASLMLGFTAHAENGDASPGDELEDLRWYDREALARDVMAGELRLPFKASIAYLLLADWFDRDGETLDELDRAAEGATVSREG